MNRHDWVAAYRKWHSAGRVELRVSAPIVLALGLAILSFSLHYAIALRLDALGVFGQYNVLFDADPNIRLDSFANGWVDRSFIHPNLANFLNPPIRALAKLARYGSLTSQSEMEVRRALALLVVPLASGLKTVVIITLFSLLGLSLLRVSLLTILSSVSFSQLVFGSIPDHFGLTGFIVALALLLSVDMIRRGGEVRWWAWIAVSVVATAVTVTNGIIVGILLGLPLVFAFGGLKKPTVITAAVLGMGAIMNLSGVFVFNRAYDIDQKSTYSAAGVGSFVGQYVRRDASSTLFRFPAAVADTFSPAAVRVIDNELGIKLGNRYPIQFSLEGVPLAISWQNILRLCVLLGLALGTLGCLRAVMPMQCLGVAAVIILAYNWALHSFWGNEFFLYSQHWHAAALVLVGGTLTGNSRFASISTFLVGLIVAGVLLNNLNLLQDMEKTLLSAS